ncbi:MAG: cysteine desulfurase [Candidatus Buchananbacteria bacterium]|nr:cysteine desulfurase [Candidatus Buchananbacteria bacterium]
MKCYFDYAATTPVDKQVVKAMMPYFFDCFGNPSSVHQLGRKSLAALDQSRVRVANFLNCQPLEVIFTSGATESNNLAIQGLVKKGDHIISSKIEHHSVLSVCQQLEKRGVEVSYVDVSQDGLVDLKSIEQSIKDNTVLVSIMYVNNETGVIQPIKEIGQLIKNINNQRKKSGLKSIYFHTDAVQAAYYCSLDVEESGVDLLSFSGHKIYGPKGVGVLYKKSGVDLSPIFFGGHQEFDFRPGTQNLAGVVGLAKAVDLILEKKHAQAIAGIKKISEQLLAGLKKSGINFSLNGSQKNKVSGITNISFSSRDSQQLLIKLDLADIALSVGSACSSGSLEKSHVLQAMNLSDEIIGSSLRLSLGYYTTPKEIVYFIKTIKSILA